MKGIMFSSPLVREILKTNPLEHKTALDLEGPYKIETRRLLPRQPIFTWPGFEWEYYPGRKVVARDYSELLRAIIGKARYKVGDDVYIKETAIVDGSGEFVGYVADKDEVLEDCKRRSALLLPEKWSRMKIHINEVDVVRVCDIYEHEAFAEGFVSIEAFWNAWAKINNVPQRDDTIAIFNEVRFTEPLAYYRHVSNFLAQDYVSGDVGRDAIFIRAGELCYAYKFTRIA